ncbi:sulfotransferase family protein [Cyanobium sp. NS01]|uniref:sulfotransferase family protein n=1 Tax=Cyanobium sp. NS01 TaxID=261284 RepID=UPI00185FBDFC|nr:sulfotransferase family protein [Cyanobium sp. NS01]QNI69791.1 sulfotransferase family protein [Cyanobium sp. NS01]
MTIFVLRPSRQGQKVTRRILKGFGLAVSEASPEVEGAAGYDTFMGVGLAGQYQDLAQRYPSSRFILLRSRGSDGQSPTATQGITAFCEEVECFFAAQPGRLLAVALPSPEAKAALKQFLGLPDPDPVVVLSQSRAARRLRQQRRRRSRSKLFCIGFHKTGTTSLERALEYLGYRVIGRRRLKGLHSHHELLEACCNLVPRYNAFQDNPWPLFYRELDARFPGSKFILTVRPPEAWLQSQVKHFGSKVSTMRQWIYGKGCSKGNEGVYLKRYNEHNAEVIDYFRDRPRDLLVLDLTAGAGWPELCNFLGYPIPSVPFPRSNTAADRKERDSLKDAWIVPGKTP